MKTIKSDVHLIHTPNTENSILFRKGKFEYEKRFMTEEFLTSSNIISNHIHFTCDLPIKDGDPVLTPSGVKRFGEVGTFLSRDVKIVASSDKSLGLPFPTVKFMEAFCKKDGIEKVLIELESYNDYIPESLNDTYVGEVKYRIKVNAHNEITTRKFTEKQFPESINYAILFNT
jgi:hypothetical protein